METPTPHREVLSYRVPQEPLPSPLLASLLAAPGLFCWVVLILAIINWGENWLQYLGVMLILWGVAILAAIASLLIYRRARKPWYVVLCLAVNISGLIFTLSVLIPAAWGRILS